MMSIECHLYLIGVKANTGDGMADDNVHCEQRIICSEGPLELISEESETGNEVEDVS